MATATRKVKRTYNLRPAIVETVRELVEARVAPTQDALVERAIRDLARQLRDQRDALSWAEAARDPVFQAELREIEEGWAIDDLRAWEDDQP